MHALTNAYRRDPLSATRPPVQDEARTPLQASARTERQRRMEMHPYSMDDVPPSPSSSPPSASSSSSDDAIAAAGTDSSKSANEYDPLAALLGQGRRTGWLNGALLGPYLQNAHLVGLGVTLLCAFAYDEHFPLTALDEHLRVAIRKALLVTFVVNAVLVVVAAREARARNQPVLFWTMKTMLLGGLALHELQTNTTPVRKRRATPASSAAAATGTESSSSEARATPATSSSSSQRRPDRRRRRGGSNGQRRPQRPKKQ